MALKVRKSPGARHIDEGEYTAVVDSIREGKGNHGPYYLWFFSVSGATDDDEQIDEDVKVSGITSDTLTPKSKLFKWAKAAGLPVDDDDSEEVDLEDAIGSVVRILVEDNESTDGEVFSRVKTVMRAKRKKGRGDPVEDATDTPKKKKRVVEDDDDDPPPRKKKPVEDDDPPPKKKRKVVEDDDDEDPPPRKRKVVEDADDDEDPPPKKKKPVEADPPKKKKVLDDDDDLFNFDEDSTDED